MTSSIDRERLAALKAREDAGLRRAPPALARALRARPGAHARRRAHELDDALVEPLPALRRRGPRRPLHLRRRPRVRRLLPRRHRRHDRPLSRRLGRAPSRSRPAAASRRCCPPRTRSGWPRARAAASACSTGSSRSRRPTPTASPCASPVTSPSGPRSSSTTTATTAPWTRPSSPSTTASRDPSRATPARRSIPTVTSKVIEWNDLGRARARRSSPATWPASSPSRR